MEFNKNLIKKMYFKTKLPKNQKNFINNIFLAEEDIFDVQKVGNNSIINAVNKNCIQSGVDCEGRIYYLYNNSKIKIDYEISFSNKNIKVYIDSIEEDTEDMLIIKHYLDMFINALVEAHTGSFECEIMHEKKPKKLIIKNTEVDNKIFNTKQQNLSIQKENDTNNTNSLKEKSENIKLVQEKTKDGDEEKMIHLNNIYENIEKNVLENNTLNIKIYFEKNIFGVTIENSEELISDFIISNKKYYTRKEKIDYLVSCFDTVKFIEEQTKKILNKDIEYKKFFVLDQEIDDNLGCPEGYIGYWNRNNQYERM